MATSHTSLENGLLSGFDLRALWETVRLRWWVIPITPLLAVGFLWAQETDLRTVPASYFVSRSYEGRDPTGVLASVGIDPVSVRSFPDVNNQLLILQSAAVRDEIAKQIGNSAAVTVTRSRPSFALIDTLESDGQSSFVFQSAGVPTYSFSCNEPERAVCDKAIDAYVAKASALRTDALRAGLNDLKAVLKETNSQSNDPALATKIAAIDVLLDRAEAPLAQINESEEAIGATLASVRRPTYTFGVAAGLSISALILLQLTYSDTRVRSLRQLAKIVGESHVVGHMSTREDPVGDRRLAINLRRDLINKSCSKIRFIPLQFFPDNAERLLRVTTLAQASPMLVSPFGELTVLDLMDGELNQIDVLLVQLHRDTQKEVVLSVSALSKGQRFAGCIAVG